jgi:PAS domain S-box-containing protein
MNQPASKVINNAVASPARTDEFLQERLLLRTLIDNLPDCIYAKDTAGRKTMANPADLKNLRCKTEAEAIGKSDFDLFPKDIAEKFWADDQKVINGEPVINREEFFLDEKGEKRWLLTTKLPLRDPNGKIVGLMGIGHDITERKQAEETIARERQLLRTLIDRLPETFYIKDLDSRFLVVNETLAKQSGKETPAQMLGLSDADLFPAGLAAQFRAEELKVFAGEPLIDHEDSMVFPDGREHTVLTTKLPFRDSQGRICGLVGIGHDITEHKRTEESLRQEQTLMATLMDNIPDTIYFKDAASRFLRVNRAHSRKRGLSDPAQIIGKSDADFSSVEHAHQALADEQEIIRTGRSLLNVEEKETWPDGTVTWVLTTKLPLCDAAGRIIGTCGMSRNITERKQAEARLELAHKQLLEVSRQAGMSEVATSVLHNVGNVLNSVNVSSSMISEKIRDSKVPNIAKAVALMRAHESDLAGFLANDPKGRKLLGYLSDLAAHLAQEQEEILQEAGSLAKKIMHIKEIVAMQQDYAKSPGILESLSGADLVEDAIRMNIGSIERHHVKLVREYAEVPPILVEKHKVLQILVNVIRNAKYACDNSGREDKQITLRIANGDHTVKISVADNGVGIPAENMTRIFNLGFTTKKNGHGFGLHSGALAAKELGGKLLAFSDGPDRGATFTLELPIQKTTATT